MVQESLTNTLKHAGPDATAEVTLTYTTTGLEVRATDSGGRQQTPGGEKTGGKPGGGRGISGMRERASLYNGTLESARLPAERLADTTPPSPGGRTPVTTVLIADDQAMQRFGFRMLLESQDDMTVVGEAGNGTEAVGLVARHHPDVVLMDIRMPGLDGIEATRRIITSGARTRVLIVTTFDLDEYAYDGLRAGASGFLVKDALPEELLSGIRAVASGDAVVAPSLTHAAPGRLRPPPPCGTGRPATGRGPPHRVTHGTGEEILTVIGQGWTNTEIAGRLHLAESTVKTHVTRILAKTGSRDRIQAVILAYDTRLVNPR